MDPLAPLIDSLHRDGRVRVWSLVITIFGDMVQHRGGEVSSVRLGQLTGRVGVESGALRTALSRLTRDGWVMRRRNGRSSLYRLTDKGVSEFTPATHRIYAPPRLDPVTRWALVVSDATNTEPAVKLIPADGLDQHGECCVIGDLAHLSEPYRARLLAKGALTALNDLGEDLGVLGSPGLSGLDAAAARMLLVHRWRRIVLRYPEPEPETLPQALGLPNPRLSVAETYARLSTATEDWLSQRVGEAPALPAADASFARRFKIAPKA